VALNRENSDSRWLDLQEAADLVPFVGHGIALREISRCFVQRPPASWMLIDTSRDSRAS
jgi:hypothetical protein